MYIVHVCKQMEITKNDKIKGTIFLSDSLFICLLFIGGFFVGFFVLFFLEGRFSLSNYIFLPVNNAIINKRRFHNVGFILYEKCFE